MKFLSFLLLVFLCTSSALYADSTTTPQTQNRDASTYNWQERHEAICARNEKIKPEIIFLGDSITHHWGGEPVAFKAVNEPALQRTALGKTYTNMGMGWDRIENVLWRVENGELDNLSDTVRVLVLLIGTNNLSVNTAPEITEGINCLIEKISKKLPKTNLIIGGILPRIETGLKCSVKDANTAIEKAVKKMNKKNITFQPLNTPFLGKNKDLKTSLFRDGLHPNEEGYTVFEKALTPAIKKAYQSNLKTNQLTKFKK